MGSGRSGEYGQLLTVSVMVLVLVSVVIGNFELICNCLLYFLIFNIIFYNSLMEYI